MEVDMTVAALRFSGALLGAEKKIRIYYKNASAMINL
jgi:hypothetical protein